MPRRLYSFHFQREMPLLTEEEFASIEVLLSKRGDHVMAYRWKHNCSLDEARARALPEALDLYESLTGC